MINNLIQIDYDNLQIKKHDNIKDVKIIEGKINFPISWLNIQGYCEYQIYLENVKGKTIPASKSMIEGTEEHQKLEDKFKETAEEASIYESLYFSRHIEPVKTREMYIIDATEGIRGYIDEIQFLDDEILIIDDKPGTKPYFGAINQVRAYGLAFRHLLEDLDVREEISPIRVALRERGTENNIFWSERFDSQSEKLVKYQIQRMQRCLKDIAPFRPTKYSNKCKTCRFKKECKECKL